MAGSRVRDHRGRALAAGAASFAVGLGAAVLLYLAGRHVGPGGPLTALVVGAGLVLGGRAIFLRVRPEPAPPPSQPSSAPPCRGQLPEPGASVPPNSPGTPP